MSVPSRKWSRAQIRRVMEDACAAIGCTPAEITGRATRGCKIMRDRRTVARALREHGISYPEIGRAMDRDHATVWHLVNDNDPVLPEFKEHLLRYVGVRPRHRADMRDYIAKTRSRSIAYYTISSFVKRGWIVCVNDMITLTDAGRALIKQKAAA